MSSSARAVLAPSELKKSCRSGATRVEHAALAGAVERGDADRAHQQRDGAAARASRPTAPVIGGRAYEHAVVAGERRQPREQREVDAERVGVARPRLDAVEAHAHERDDEVEQREDRERLRLAPARPAQLADAEEQDPRRRGPAPQPRRIGQRLGRRDARDDEADRAADRAPRAEQAEDVAEHERGDRHAHPQHDVDGGRREVVVLGRPCPRGRRRRPSRRRRRRRARAARRPRAAAGTAGARAAPAGAAPTTPPRARGTRRRARPPPRRRTRPSGSAGRRGRRGRGRRGPRGMSLRTTTAPPRAGPSHFRRSALSGLRALRGRLARGGRLRRRGGVRRERQLGAEDVLLLRAAERRDEAVLALLVRQRAPEVDQSGVQARGGLLQVRAGS